MNAQDMLTELHENYQTLKAQFKKADLSKISPTKLAELMFRHLMAIQKLCEFLAKQQDPGPQPPTNRDRQGAGNSSPAKPQALPPAKPPVAAASAASGPSKAQPPKSDAAVRPDLIQDVLDHLKERPDYLSANLARSLGVDLPSASPQKPPIPHRPAMVAPPRDLPREERRSSKA